MGNQRSDSDKTFVFKNIVDVDVMPRASPPALFGLEALGSRIAGRGQFYTAVA